jgi:O-methyltransferase involved in polyketide biosynthesis
MANRGAGGTAIGAAICRLGEQYQRPRTRQFNDPVLEELVSWQDQVRDALPPLKRISRSLS